MRKNNFFDILKNFFISLVARYAKDQRKNTIEYWRRILFFSVYYLVFTLGCISYIIVVMYYAMHEKTSDIIAAMVGNTIMLSLAAVILFVRKIPFDLNSKLGSLFFYVLGVIMLSISGPFGDAQAWFFAFVILASIFTGFKFSFFGSVLVYVTNIGISVFYRRSGINASFDDFYFPSWVILSTNYFIVSVILIFAISIFLKKVIQSFDIMEKSKTAIIVGLAKLTEYKDDYTGAHLERISKYTLLIAERLSKMDEFKDIITVDYKENLELSSILHDIGKVGIPDNVLLKPARLSPDEFNVIKNHTIYGGDVLAKISKNVDDKSFYQIAQYIAYFHHEKWDGSGYPKGLKGEDIPLAARITALADVYDALTSKRSYKDSYSHERAREIIVGERGKHFDPLIVDVFLELEDEFIKINELYQS